MKIYLNGIFVDKEDAKISVFDHSLLYGDGVFEGIRIYNSCVFKLEEHLERLEFSARLFFWIYLWFVIRCEAVCDTCLLTS